jgi:hypothetical protein
MKVRGFPTNPSDGFFCSSINIRGIATKTGSHFQIFHSALNRIPIRNKTFPSAPTSAVCRPLLIAPINNNVSQN